MKIEQSRSGPKIEDKSRQPNDEPRIKARQQAEQVIQQAHDLQALIKKLLARD
jgi:hypothetical protein